MRIPARSFLFIVLCFTLSVPCAADLRIAPVLRSFTPCVADAHEQVLRSMVQLTPGCGVDFGLQVAPSGSATEYVWGCEYVQAQTMFVRHEEDREDGTYSWDRSSVSVVEIITPYVRGINYEDARAWYWGLGVGLPFIKETGVLQRLLFVKNPLRIDMFFGLCSWEALCIECGFSKYWFAGSVDTLEPGQGAFGYEVNYQMNAVYISAVFSM